MYFFTHLFISRKLYKHFLGELSLDKRAFAYGNIKPDISKDNLHNNTHTLENYLFYVNERAIQIIEKDNTITDLSSHLGEICHYVCDFFCYYHLNDAIYNRMFRHFLYELRLHYVTYVIYYNHKLKISSTRKEPRKNISSIILEMRREYLSQPESYKRDIDYALQTAIWTCESILYYMKYPSVATQEPELAIQTLLPVEGGRI